MCMLTYFPPGALPDPDGLGNGAEFNNDGHGFALVVAGRIIMRHSMNGTALIDQFADVRAQCPGGPALFHSRFATHGTRSRANCHPFRVGNDARTVLAHNGILPRRVQPIGGDRRSDTRIAAEDFLPAHPFSSWDDLQAQRGLTQWLGLYNKLVVLTVDPRYDQSAYLLNEQAGVWDEGIWYSNTDYQGYTVPGTDLLPNTAYRLEDCPACLTTAAVDPHGYCLVCGACADCGEPDGYCACYSPGRFPDPRAEHDGDAGADARWPWSIAASRTTSHMAVDTAADATVRQEVLS